MYENIYRLAQGVDVSKLPGANGGPTTEQSIPVLVNIAFGIFGAVAMLVITIAGLQYVLSQGDPQKTARAKDAILYAVVGLVVTFLSYGIVNFVIGKV